jgi:hypothetical protein
VVEAHRRTIRASGGADIRNTGALERVLPHIEKGGSP